jgi:hypothetical protein
MVTIWAAREKSPKTISEQRKPAKAIASLRKESVYPVP